MAAGNGEGGGRVYDLQRSFQRLGERPTVDDGALADVVSFAASPSEEPDVYLDRVNALLDRWRSAFSSMDLPGGFVPLEPCIEPDSPASHNLGAYRPAEESGGEYDELGLKTYPENPSLLLRSLTEEGLRPAQLKLDLHSPSIKARFMDLLGDVLTSLKEALMSSKNDTEDPEEDGEIADNRVLVPRAAVRCLLQLDHCVTHKTLDSDDGALQLMLSNYDYAEDPLSVHGFASLTLFLGEHTSVVIHPDDGITHLYFVQDNQASPGFIVPDPLYCEKLFTLIMGEIEAVSTGWGLS